MSLFLFTKNQTQKILENIAYCVIIRYNGRFYKNVYAVWILAQIELKVQEGCIFKIFFSRTTIPEMTIFPQKLVYYEDSKL